MSGEKDCSAFLCRPHPLILSSAQPLSSQNHIEISSVEPCTDAIPHAIQQCTIRALRQPHPLISKSSELGAREYHLKSRRTYQFVHSSFNCTCVCLPTLDHKALVVVHETMTIRSAMPYVSQRMRPLPCLEICGRSRDLLPKCPTTHSVWGWWKDCSHILMLSCLHFFSKHELRPAHPSPKR